ncbi:MAG TPA: alpha/beta fold hydrolase [Acidimicrobiales bacterium]
MSRGIVLVHGACHGPWCWEKVAPLLEQRGFAVETPDLYKGPHPTDPGVVQDAVDRLGRDGPVVVCGHSFGGYAITRLDPTNVAHLVYLAAILPDHEQWYTELPTDPSFFERVSIVDGVMTIKPECARELFYADCDDADIERAIAQLCPHPMDGAGLVIERPAWRAVPTTYVRCADDNTLTPTYQQAAIERVGNGVTWPTSHSPFYSRPELVADLLSDIAASALGDAPSPAPG